MTAVTRKPLVAKPLRSSFVSRYIRPRIWAGMNLGAWWRLLARNRFDVDWRFWPTALGITFWAGFNTLIGGLTKLTVGRRARRQEIVEPPLFILGHWRSGTTLLHELMVLDPRMSSPTTYACMAPHHFLLTESFAERWLKFLLPSKRPMDNMATGWNKPQEDEFALCLLGERSPYNTIAFPNRSPQDQEYLTLDDVPTEARARWQRGLMRFLRALSYRDPRRLVLKSPTHTARIAALLEMFPDARFVHIVRDPWVVFPSTVHLWKQLYLQSGLQDPHCQGLDEQVLATFTRMYESFFRDVALIPPERFCELRYEDLVQDPVGQMQMIYETLGLGNFDAARSAIEAYWAANEGYQTNRYELSDELREAVRRRWSSFIERYGYGDVATGGGSLSRAAT